MTHIIFVGFVIVGVCKVVRVHDRHCVVVGIDHTPNHIGSHLSIIKHITHTHTYINACTRPKINQ